MEEGSILTFETLKGTYPTLDEKMDFLSLKACVVQRNLRLHMTRLILGSEYGVVADGTVLVKRQDRRVDSGDEKFRCPASVEKRSVPQNLVTIKNTKFPYTVTKYIINVVILQTFYLHCCVAHLDHGQ
jgi:hypothetical protein